MHELTELLERSVAIETAKQRDMARQQADADHRLFMSVIAQEEWRVHFSNYHTDSDAR